MMPSHTFLKEVCENGCEIHSAGAVMDIDLYEITVPRKFFLDHESRGLVSTHSMIEPGGVRIIKHTQSTLTVLLTWDDIAELHSDAEYYWSIRQDMISLDGIGAMGLCQSAKATVAKINKWFSGHSEL